MQRSLHAAAAQNPVDDGRTRRDRVRRQHRQPVPEPRGAMDRSRISCSSALPGFSCLATVVAGVGGFFFSARCSRCSASCSSLHGHFEDRIVVFYSGKPPSRLPSGLGSSTVNLCSIVAASIRVKRSMRWRFSPALENWPYRRIRGVHDQRVALPATMRDASSTCGLLARCLRPFVRIAPRGSISDAFRCPESARTEDCCYCARQNRSNLR